MNIAFLILSILDIIAELTELTYDLGAATRKYVLPALVFTYVFIDKVVDDTLDYLTTSQFTLKVRNTPMTTGFAYAT